MSFTVDDFQDLLRLLDQHPEWQAELRRRLLTEELLGLPALVRELAAAQARTEQRLEGLTARVEELAAAQARTERQLGELVAAQHQTTSQLEALDDRVGRLVGDVLELRYERHAHAYFGPFARKIRVVAPVRLGDLLDDAVEAGLLTHAERTAVLRADLVLTGRRHEDGADVYLLIEVSSKVGMDDVHRAVDRASMLAKLGRPVMPIVAGESIGLESADLARVRGVWQVLDGQVTPPG